MKISDHLTCPACQDNHLVVKHVATYIYSYWIDSDAPGHKNKEEFLPFLFDNREKVDGRQYIECSSCGAQYPCSFDVENKGIDFTIVQKAIRSDHTTTPEFLG